MSHQPWETREYTWCDCGTRIVNDGDIACTMCSAHMRLHELDLDTER